MVLRGSGFGHVEASARVVVIYACPWLVLGKALAFASVVAAGWLDATAEETPFDGYKSH